MDDRDDLRLDAVRHRFAAAEERLQELLKTIESVKVASQGLEDAQGGLQSAGVKVARGATELANVSRSLSAVAEDLQGIDLEGLNRLETSAKQVASNLQELKSDVGKNREVIELSLSKAKETIRESREMTEKKLNQQTVLLGLIFAGMVVSAIGAWIR